MGLDAWLYKEHYVKNWDFEKTKNSVEVRRDGKIREDIDPKRIVTVTEEVAYWRKANAIHKWFIDKCADGDEGRRRMWVSTECLEELLKTVNKVLESCELVDGEVESGWMFEHEKVKKLYRKGKYIKDPSLAKELLPTTEGFFFGSINYGDTYVEDLEYTKKILEEELKKVSKEKDFVVDYFYEASW